MSTKQQLMPREEMLEVADSGRRFSIGLPREMSYQEKRIALVPAAVNMLVENDHEVIVQRNAGQAAYFTNQEYAEAGAQLVDSAAEVFKSEIILKVAPPTMDEISMMPGRQSLLSALHLAACSKEYLRALIDKRFTALAFEYIKDKSNDSPVVKSISEIAGTASIHIAAEYLSHEKYGTGRMLGGFTGIAPSEVVVIGAGTVGEYACRTALGMGALVKVFDNSIYKLQRLKTNLHQNIFTSTLQEAELLRALKTADVLICAVYAKSRRAPVIISAPMVESMKQGAVIVDVSIDQGGCVETSHITSHKDPVFKYAGVTHYCVPNIASRFPQTASIALSNYFAPVLMRAGELGGIEKLLVRDYFFRQGAYLFNGILTSKPLGEYLNLPYQDIDLLMAAFQ
ncbi:MAG: alanine dehydrogenase [Bacteroidales bacterium]|nr:alanine dehydrogenase [Bacteroidales bacterium]